MLGAELCDNSLSMYKPIVSEIHRSKISLHHAKAGYNYPTIRLPRNFSKLAGLRTRIYQTVHDGALAFLVVVSKGTVSKTTDERSENASKTPKSSVLTWQRELTNEARELS